MLPDIATLGDNEYTKSIVLYIHNMQKLEETPTVHANFTDDYWAAIYRNIYVEHMLMGSIMSVSGSQEDVDSIHHGKK